MNEYFHHVARGIIIKDKRVLLSRAEGYPNLLFLPGGHIEFGESAKDALKRELMEELGIDCYIGSFLGLIENKWESDGGLNCEINQLFAVESDDLQTGLNPISNEAHLTFFWMEVEDLEIKNLQPYPIDRFLQQYTKGNKEVWWASSLT
ncbi:NUDIX domain-containing protein [Pullulanibacillus sp. KACC 23026]|uniref:NUDIX domain-containing protein n=1 Tax=Pullulanibacillus sp. KACC 23026 TaxID=3028315 RepID=UPI0023B0A920|nr:NUDIX domain-containing protein [Pullulanibacillus sp. KACC 23026]WEG14837.1 NUDIX domain-containing protein [Pullulanibacillus sp. KACC 23026]